MNWSCSNFPHRRNAPRAIDRPTHHPLVTKLRPAIWIWIQQWAVSWRLNWFWPIQRTGLGLGTRRRSLEGTRCREDVEVYGYTKKTYTVAQHGLAAMSLGVRAVMPRDCSLVGSNQLSLQRLPEVRLTSLVPGQVLCFPTPVVVGAADAT